MMRTLLLACAMAATRLECEAFSSLPSPSSSRLSKSRTAVLPQQNLSSQRRDLVRTKRSLSHGSDDDYHVHVRHTIVTIEKHEDFVNFLEEDERLCIVKFYASWCKSCQRFGTKFRKLALDEGDRINYDGSVVKLGNVRFAEVEYTVNARLCKSLKVRKLPTVHMYRKGSGKIADMTCKPSQFQLVIDEMNRLMDSSAEGVVESSLSDDIRKKESQQIEGISNNTDASFERTMTAGSNLADEIMTEMKKEQENEHDEVVKEKKSPFTEIMETGSNLADEIAAEMRKKRESELKEDGKEKKLWFPFTF